MDATRGRNQLELEVEELKLEKAKERVAVLLRQKRFVDAELSDAHKLVRGLESRCKELGGG